VTEVCHISAVTHFFSLTGFIPLGVEQPGREADNSPSSSTEDKNLWSHTYTPFLTLCLIMVMEVRKCTNYTLLYHGNVVANTVPYMNQHRKG
jgi:hypothetical protein